MLARKWGQVFVSSQFRNKCIQSDAILFKTRHRTISPPCLVTHSRRTFYDNNLDEEKGWKRVYKKGREFRLWTIDKIVAVTSGVVIGTTTWILIGTTTLISVILWLVNQFDEDGRITQMVSNYLTKSSGLQIRYEHAEGTSIFKEGTIRLKNVTVYRPKPEDNENHSLIDLTIDEIEVKLSAVSLLEGRGIVTELTARGIRGLLDRRTEKPDPNYKAVRRTWQRGDFEFEKLIVEDVLLTVYMPYEDARPLSLTIYNMECGPFRKQRLLEDLFCAKSIVGIFDGCLFNYGPPQRLYQGSGPRQEMERILKIDGISMDLFSKNASGPLGWIKDGTLDIALKVVVPTVPPKSFYNLFQENTLLSKKIQMHWAIRLNHTKFDPPLYTPELSYFNNALAQPISRYMNAHSKHIGLSFEMYIPEDHFDGSWTPAQAHLWDALSEAVYQSLAVAVEEQKRETNWKKLLSYTWKFLFG